jgi:quercetin dioxygenase-like cupin family protein
MRLYSVLLGAALSVVSVSGEAAQNEATPRNVLRSAAVPVVPVAAWMDGTNLKTVRGQDEVARAPAAASHYLSKTYKFRSGMIEIFTAEKGGAVMWPIGPETELYVISGAAEVGVGGVVTDIGAGDTVSYPTGILRSKGSNGAVIVAYSVGTTAERPKSMVVRGKDVPDVQLAQWVRDGKQIASKTPEEFANAPADAQIHLTKRYEFDGNSMRVPYWNKKQGSPDIVGAPVVPKDTALLYIWQGHGHFTYGGQESEIYAGDAIEEGGGVAHAWIVKDSMRFTATDAPSDPKRP